MSEKPRRWFQIHLSTALLLMIIAGILLGLNVSFIDCGPVYEADGWCYNYKYGWPVFVQSHHYVTLGSETVIINFAYIWNGMIALFCLSMIAFVCEYNVRCRRTGKP